MNMNDMTQVTVKQDQIDNGMHKAKAVAIMAICDVHEEVMKQGFVTSEQLDNLKDAVEIVTAK